MSKKTSMSRWFGNVTFLALAALAPNAAAFSEVVSSVGPGGVIPDGPDGGGAWNATPDWPEVNSPVTVPSRLGSVTAVTIEGLHHAWRGDLHVYLEDPLGARFNLIVRPGYAGGADVGDSGGLAEGTYTLVESGEPSLAQGSTQLLPGTYDAYLNTGDGSWTSHDFPIANVPLGSIAGGAGTWRLHVRDWYEGEVGWFTGWKLIGEPPPGDVTAFCFGDGLGMECPCGPDQSGAPEHGCKNSKPDSTGCSLTAVHSTNGAPNPSVSVTANELGLKAEGMLAGSYTIFLQGTETVNGGLGETLVPDLDGLQCVGGTLVRLGRITTMGGTNILAGVAGVAGLAGAQTKHYQVVYRNSINFCTPATLNTSNGLTVHWTP
jgi:hypothetical protein